MAANIFLESILVRISGVLSSRWNCWGPEPGREVGVTRFPRSISEHDPARRAKAKGFGRLWLGISLSAPSCFSTP